MNTTNHPTIYNKYQMNYLDNDTQNDVVAVGKGSDGKFHLYLQTNENQWVAVDQSLLDVDGDGQADTLVLPTTPSGPLYAHAADPRAYLNFPERLTHTKKDCNHFYDKQGWKTTYGALQAPDKIQTKTFGDLGGHDENAFYNYTHTECTYTQYYDVNGDGAQDVAKRAVEEKEILVHKDGSPITTNGGVSGDDLRMKTQATTNSLEYRLSSLPTE